MYNVVNVQSSNVSNKKTLNQSGPTIAVLNVIIKAQRAEHLHSWTFLSIENETD